MNVINGLADPMQRSRGADGKIGHGHVIINRSNEPDDPEVPVSRNLFIGDAIFLTSTLRHLEEWGDDTPCDRSVWMSVGHSALKISAPVKEPSPPHTTSASMPSLIRLYAALRRPSGVRNA
jgi:hypothetical protein